MMIAIMAEIDTIKNKNDLLTAICPQNMISAKLVLVEIINNISNINAVIIEAIDCPFMISIA